MDTEKETRTDELDGSFVRQLFDQMPSKVKTGMLFDVYGVLLNEHRQTVLSLWINDDYSLSEIADELSITRQGVHDTIKKSEKWLFDMEEQLGIVSRIMIQNELIRRYQSSAQQKDSEICMLLEKIKRNWEEKPWPLRD